MNRLTKKLALATALFGAPAVLALPVAAEASVFAPLTLEQFTDASTYIVRGTVTEVWTEVVDDRYVWTRARVRVADVFKGPDSPTELIIDSLGGTHGDVELKIEGACEFTVGEEALFFLTNSGKNLSRLVPVSKFLGKQIIRRAPGDSRRYLITFHPQHGISYDSRFLPHPAEDARKYYDDVLDRIQVRLASGWDGQPIPGISAERLAEINTPARRLR